MYIFTKHGLAAFASYEPDKKNANGWLDDNERLAIHESALSGERHYVVRGWHRDLIKAIIGPDQQVFVDLDADYPYRGLVWAEQMPGIMDDLVSGIDYYSLKASVTGDWEYYRALAATHAAAKEHMDPRLPMMGWEAWFSNDGFATEDDEVDEDATA